MGEHVAPTTPAKKKRSNIFWNIVGVVGELLITFAIIVGLFSVWQLFWTTYPVSTPPRKSTSPPSAPSAKYAPTTRRPSTAKSATAKSTASSTCPPGTG